MGSFNLLQTDSDHGGFSDSGFTRSSALYQVILPDMSYVCPISLPLIPFHSFCIPFPLASILLNFILFQGREIRSDPTNCPTMTLPFPPIVYIVCMTLTLNQLHGRSLGLTANALRN